jgi:hypothetical protein
MKQADRFVRLWRLGLTQRLVELASTDCLAAMTRYWRLKTVVWNWSSLVQLACWRFDSIGWQDLSTVS